MPQIGREPGASRTISGCIGHVHSTFVTGATSTGSSAMPHFGHAPGPFWRTSGSIGHVYSRSMSAAVAGAMRRSPMKASGLARNCCRQLSAAEEVCRAFVIDVADRVVRQDRHSAHRVENLSGSSSGVVVRVGRHIRVSGPLTQPVSAYYRPRLAAKTFPAQTRRKRRAGQGYFANWPGFASNLALQPLEQK